MTTERGRDIQLTKQTGEHLVVAELGRRKYTAAPFAGNLPDFDLFAANSIGQTIPIQVKTINGGSWQFAANKFCEIELTSDGIQHVKNKKNLPNERVVCALVFLKKGEKDAIYLLDIKELQNIIFNEYKKWIDSLGGKRPKNPKSFHTIIKPEQVEKFKDNWEVIEKMIAATPVEKN
jgi:hypothetical protein